MKSNKKYLVIFQDEYNNLYYVGKYNELDDCIEDVNGHLNGYGVSLNKGDIREYPSTFGMAFDTNIGDLFEDREDLYGLMIRGFILEEGE